MSVGFPKAITAQISLDKLFARAINLQAGSTSFVKISAENLYCNPTFLLKIKMYPPNNRCSLFHVCKTLDEMTVISKLSWIKLCLRKEQCFSCNQKDKLSMLLMLL